jgi:hypothetical protein
MNTLGLAAPNRIRCQRAAVARPYGGSLRLRGLVVDIAERFWKRVDTSAGMEACWPWTGGHSRAGYGFIWRNGRNVPATHVALDLAGRTLAPGMESCHTCDNPPCVNPAHLFEGTTAVNAQDREAKGRGRWVRISSEGRARHAEATARGLASRTAARTTCVRGHVLSPDNICRNPRGWRRCLACHRDESRARRQGERDRSRGLCRVTVSRVPTAPATDVLP